jgi:hypothetical protein
LSTVQEMFMRGSRHWVHWGARCFAAAVLALCGLCSGCAVIAVADAVVTTGVVVVKTGVKATGAVIGAVIPD